MARTIQTPPSNGIARAVALTVSLAALLALLWVARATLLTVFAGMLAGIGLRAAADGIRRLTRLPIVACVWLALVVCALAIGGAIVLAGPGIAEQLAQLQRAFGPALSRALAAFDATSLLPNFEVLVSSAGGLVYGALGGAMAVLIVAFIAIAGALEPELYRDGALQLFPPPQRARLAAVLHDLMRTLRTWLVARLLSMCVTGVLVGIGLSTLHVPLAGALAVLAGLLAFIPNIGAFIAGAPAVVLAFASRPRLALIVLLMYVLVHFIDDFFVTPFVDRQMVRLPPILTLVAQIILGLAAGGLGVMLAAPVVATLLVLVRRLWVEPLDRQDAA